MQGHGDRSVELGLELAVTADINLGGACTLAGNQPSESALLDRHVGIELRSHHFHFIDGTISRSASCQSQVDGERGHQLKIDVIQRHRVISVAQIPDGVFLSERSLSGSECRDCVGSRTRHDAQRIRKQSP